jgi:hypothetical protein
MKKLYLLFLLFFISNAFGYITETQTNACGITAIRFYAHYTPYSYTCDAGYFLPANTLGCRACPSGYTCAGGTFTFNEKQSQGAVKNTNITTQNVTNSCAVNFPHKLFAKFSPKTMNLTWDDAQGNTTTSTCTYDGLITVPPDPEPRPGYVFKGWKVQTNE